MERDERVEEEKSQYLRCILSRKEAHRPEMA